MIRSPLIRSLPVLDIQVDNQASHTPLRFGMCDWCETGNLWWGDSPEDHQLLFLGVFCFLVDVYLGEFNGVTSKKLGLGCLCVFFC